VKSFVSESNLTELQRALGQYLIYKSWLAEIEPERLIYLALDTEPFEDLFVDVSGRILLKDYKLGLIVIDSEKEEIIEWIN
jgi:hypothetical protein